MTVGEHRERLGLDGTTEPKRASGTGRHLFSAVWLNLALAILVVWIGFATRGFILLWELGYGILP